MYIEIIVNVCFRIAVDGRMTSYRKDQVEDKEDIFNETHAARLHVW